jgi:hypothetical protein
VCFTCSETTCRHCEQSDLAKCLVCREGYLLENSKCAACPENCAYCSKSSNNTKKCYQCVAGYSVVDNACVKCADKCTTCLNGDPSICSTCKSWEYLDYKTGLCAKCREGCSQCTNGEDCSVFESGVVLYRDQVIRCAKGCVACDSVTP